MYENSIKDLSNTECIKLNVILQGLPFPSEESNAIDVVIKYAVCELEFSFEDIIIYGWSVGKDDDMIV